MSERPSSPFEAQRKPLIFREGAVEVRIYLYPAKNIFTVAWVPPEGGRKRKNFTKLEEAKGFARSIATRLAKGDAAVLRLSAVEAHQHVAAVERLEAIGVKFQSAVDEYLDARSLMPPGVSLLEAVREFARRHPATMVPMTVEEVLAELIATKTKTGKSEMYLFDLRSRLGKFARWFKCPIGVVTPALVGEYLDSLKTGDGKSVKNITINNVLRLIIVLFGFAKRKGYVTKDHADEILGIEKPKPESVEIGVFTPSQIQAILDHAPDDSRASLAIGAFAGIRTEEIQRLQWGKVDLKERQITVDAGKSKTGMRRIIPIPDNLALWLAPVAKDQGCVTPEGTSRQTCRRWGMAAKKAGLKWVKNGLRHSFISYRLAVVRNKHAVAEEAGNSPKMIDGHYKALVTEAQGKEWFAVCPRETSGDVVQRTQVA